VDMDIYDGYPRKKSVDMGIDVDEKFHIHSKPAY